MNRLFSVICLTFFALAGCQQVSLDQASFDDSSYVEFTAEMEGFESDTKTSLAPNRTVVWSVYSDRIVGYLYND